ncbi:hypothetical protein OUZ56_000088 [Daphnia magna]|uniref:Uncharacterized protein n=1 Tax=Daphnia magna TaxID=35525 RepID=A0ABQ9ZYN5_9CRUS|nr:hypothetical protein OUZ56_000088 [Daphnia magna]
MIFCYSRCVFLPNSSEELKAKSSSFRMRANSRHKLEGRNHHGGLKVKDGKSSPEIKNLFCSGSMDGRRVNQRIHKPADRTRNWRLDASHAKAGYSNQHRRAGHHPSV